MQVYAVVCIPIPRSVCACIYPRLYTYIFVIAQLCIYVNLNKQVVTYVYIHINTCMHIGNNKRMHAYLRASH